MAQALAQKIFKDMNIKAQVSSAGIGANPFDSASQNSILAMKNYDIDISNHKSKQITKIKKIALNRHDIWSNLVIII